MQSAIGPVRRGFDSRKLSGSHYTPPALASFIARRLLQQTALNHASRIRVLDPSCGDGELLLAFGREVAKRDREKVLLFGIEADEGVLEKARERLGRDQPCSYQIFHGDFLDLAGALRGSRSLWQPAYLPDALAESADVIIANPPYVRTQIIGASTSQRLASRFGLSGRVDLYHAFFVAMTDFLQPGGHLGVVTSNRYLTTKAGASVRDFLARHYDINQIVDLGDTKLFEAAVLPALFFATKVSSEENSGRSKSALFVRIYENVQRDVRPASTYRVASVVDILSSPRNGEYEVSDQRYTVTTGTLCLPPLSSEPWALTTSVERQWLKSIDSRRALRFSEVAKIRVGVKTTADDIFVRSDWDALPPELHPETELLRPLISHDDAQRWRHTSQAPSRRILYTHEVKDGCRVVIDFSRYPRAWAYLNEHRKPLEARQYIRDAGRKWYEIWVPQDPVAWPQRKVVFPDISPNPIFFLDTDGCLVDGNCYWITLDPGQDPDLLFLIMAVANSRLMARYHDLSFPNRLYAGRRRYLTQYVEKYPIPDPDSEASKRLIVLARRLALESVSDHRRETTEIEAESLVASSFGVSVRN